MAATKHVTSFVKKRSKISEEESDPGSPPKSNGHIRADFTPTAGSEIPIFIPTAGNIKRPSGYKEPTAPDQYDVVKTKEKGQNGIEIFQKTATQTSATTTLY